MVNHQMPDHPLPRRHGAIGPAGQEGARAEIFLLSSSPHRLESSHLKGQGLAFVPHVHAAIPLPDGLKNRVSPPKSSVRMGNCSFSNRQELAERPLLDQHGVASDRRHIAMVMSEGSQRDSHQHVKYSPAYCRTTVSPKCDEAMAN